jgi:trigger factor
VVKVEREVLPEINDDFVRLINPDLKSIDDLNKDVLDKINQNFEERSRQTFEKDLSDALIEKIGVETPPSMVNNYLNNILEDVKKQNNGEKIDEEKVLETYRPSAERNLKWYLIRKKIIDQEQISIGRSDIDAEIENLVSRSPNSEKEIRRFYKKPSNRQKIEDDITEKKILEYLTQFAKIKEVEVNTKDIRGENK